MTEKLYYRDSHLFRFTSEVLRCEEADGRYLVVLAATAFFPEGGGQPADTGILGGVRVLDAHEKNGEVLHCCDGPLPVGAAVTGEVDAEQRLRRMQNHSGEHVFSGTAHRLFGCDNVGFHMGAEDMTLDFDYVFTADDVARMETLANEAVRQNLPIKVSFPSPEALALLEYRSKKELSGEVRIVEIPGVDRCACCAPHVSFTGEIGIIKVLNFEKHRGGTRISLLCGMQALEDYRRKLRSASEISALLSVKRDAVAEGVRRLMEERDALKEKRAALSLELMRLKAAAVPDGQRNLCLFVDVSDEIAARELCNLIMEKCSGLAAVFFPASEGGFRYIIGSCSVDLRKAGKAINAGIQGRGGGRPEMIQGSARATEAEIREFIENC